MSSITPSHPSPTQPDATSPVSSAPGNLRGHAWNDIGSKAQDVLGGLKGKWNANTPQEKRYLTAAATVLAIALVLFSLSTFVFGFAAVGILIQGLAPIAFMANFPLLLYAKSKRMNAPSTAKEQKKLEEEEKKLEAARKAVKIQNEVLRRQMKTQDTFKTPHQRS
ncbi:MAG: hypothetical protein ACSNEK_07880 [Parachlamydiaceae bacterium]